MDKEEKIWYASYGSNILESRFHCYILGGKPKGAATRYKGCTNKNLPSEKESIEINSELYFAKKSSNWKKGGVAFIKPNLLTQNPTLGRMYLITTSQFIEVVEQETNFKGKLKIDFKRASNSGTTIFKSPSWYGCLIYLGEKNDYPIFTFTNEEILTKEINPPSKEYLETIINGIKETYEISNKELKEYLNSKVGIKDFDIENQLDALIGTEKN